MQPMQLNVALAASRQSELAAIAEHARKMQFEDHRPEDRSGKRVLRMRAALAHSILFGR